MRKNEFLNSVPVKNFICWFEVRMDNCKTFNHSYLMKKPVKRWECSSVYSAFEAYYWGNKSFFDNAIYLSKLSHELKESI